MDNNKVSPIRPTDQRMEGFVDAINIVRNKAAEYEAIGYVYGERVANFLAANLQTIAENSIKK